MCGFIGALRTTFGIAGDCKQARSVLGCAVQGIGTKFLGSCVLSGIMMNTTLYCFFFLLFHAIIDNKRNAHCSELGRFSLIVDGDRHMGDTNSLDVCRL